MTRASNPPGGARERLILAAEQLIAERGPGVPLRDIAAAAGQRNNSAIQYHFGSRDGLIEAVVEYRLSDLEVRRLELLAEQAGSGADDVHGLLEALVLPMLELSDRAGIHYYARFFEQIHSHPVVTDVANLDDESRTSVRVIMRELRGRLAGLPAGLLVRRLRALPTMLFALLADHERAVEAGRVEAGRTEAWGEIVDMLAGALTAPVVERASGRESGGAKSRDDVTGRTTPDYR